MCDIYQTPEDKVACEYLAYLNQKKYPINQSPTIAILEGFENEILKPLASKKNEKQTGPVVYNSSTLPQFLPSAENTTLDDEDEDGDLSSYYGGTEKKPDRSRQTKREFSPDGKEFSSKKKLGGSSQEVSLSDNHDTSITKGTSSVSMLYYLLFWF